MQSANASCIVLAGFQLLLAHRHLYFLLMSSAFLLILGSNFTVLFLIWRHRLFLQPMYVFIAALLVNSVLFSWAIYPKLLLDFLSAAQTVSYSGCLLQFLLFYCLSGSEFFLLSAMAFDRYASICRPLHYDAIMRRSRVKLLLAAAWLLPVCQTSVPVLLSADMKLCRHSLRGILCNNALYGLHCASSGVLRGFGVAALVNMALIPLLFILFTYGRILLASYRSSRSVRTKAAQTCSPHLLVLLSFTCLCAYDIISARLASALPWAAHVLMTLQAVLYHPLLNPLIYGLKLRQISGLLRGLLCRGR
ncbi:uncharacterized protein V6R79_003858 [Siganus canaliculatus]